MRGGDVSSSITFDTGQASHRTQPRTSMDGHGQRWFPLKILTTALRATHDCLNLPILDDSSRQPYARQVWGGEG
jgi:hypothetical protein